jgi:hypothetical protein
MIILGGIPLTVPTPQLISEIEQNIDLEKMLIFFSRSWPGFGNVGLALPTHYRRWPPWTSTRNIISRMFWPTGASRYGVGAFLASKDQCNALQNICFGSDGSESNQVTLSLSSEDQFGNTIEEVDFELLTLMPPIPLFSVLNPDNSTNYGSYLLIVVDQRFYWWNVATPNFGITESAGVTWIDVITSIGLALEADITYSDIPAAYLQPHRALNLTNEPLPLIFDSVAYNLGMRVVYDYTGDIYLESWTDAYQDWQNDVTSDVGVARTVRAGDYGYVDNF